MKEYFSHDFNARNDPRLQAVIMELGMAGIGLYWCIIEQLYEQGGKLPLSSIKSLAFAYHIDAEVVKSLIMTFDLFSHDKKHFWSDSAVKRIQVREDKIKALSEAGKRGNDIRWGKKSQSEASEIALLSPGDNQAIATQSRESRQAIAIKENKIKENKIKENKIKENKIKENKNNIDIYTNIDFRVSDEIIDRENSEPGGSVSLPTDPASTSKIESIDWVKLRDFWNDTVHGKISNISVITDNRKSAIRARMNTHGKQAIFDVITKTARSDFLIGNNNRNWRADFDWVFRPNNFVKVLEGKYDNTNTQSHENKDAKNNRRGYTDYTSTSADDYKGGF